MSSKPRIMPAGMESDDDEDFDDYERTLRENVKKTSANLKITVVPDISSNIILNGATFDIRLDQDIESWFQNLKQIWLAYKKGGIITNHLKQFYSMRPNPYLEGLKLYANCSEHNSCKTTSLSYTIIEELHNFKTSNGLINDALVDDDLKVVAYNFARINSQHTFFRMIVNIFNLTASKHLFVDKIQELLSQHNYKDACNFSHELQLHEHFTLFDFLFPLILQDKLSTVEAYLESAVHLQRPLIELLDSLLDRSSSVQNICENYVYEYNYKDVSLYKLQPKTLSKLIKRLAKSYNLLDTDAMPNLKKIKSYGQLQFLLHKKYAEKSLNKDSWQEMVRDVVPKNSNVELQLELIHGCSFNRDIIEAAFWARYFNIPAKHLPILVQEFLEKSESSDISESVEALSITDDWNTSEVQNKPIAPKANKKLYHTLSLDKAPIILVDKREKFYQMLQKLTVEYVIAFDAEWKPISCSTAEVALIQIATKHQIYLIDVVSIDLVADDWNNLAQHVFNNVEILKIGYSPLADLKMFQRTMPSIVLTSQTLTSYLDLQTFWQALLKIPNFRFPYQNCDELEAGMSLSNLVQNCFGKSLDKSNQFSNWENRPLRNEQILYAALDAYCLLEIYDVIKLECQKISIDINDLIQNFLTDNKNKLVFKKGNQTNQSVGNGNRLQQNQRQLKYNSVQSHQKKQNF